MIDGMFQEGTDAALDDQVRRPRSVVLKPPPFSLKETTAAAFQGIGGGVAKSIAFGAELSGAFGQVAGAYPEMFGGQLSQQQRMEAETARQKLYTQGVDYSNEGGDIFRARAKDILPDAQTTHASAQVVAGLTDFATRAVGYTVTLGPLGPAMMGGDAGLEEADRLKQQGVDLPTRTKAGAVAGVLNAAAVAIPLQGATAVTRFAKGVAVGESTIVGQSLAEQHILRAAGYDKIADSFDPLDPVALAMGVVPGALGAKFGHAPAAKPVAKPAPRALHPEAGPDAAAFQAATDAARVDPARIGVLQAEMAKAETTVAERARLQKEIDNIHAAATEHGVSEAVKTEPDLVPAARVAQVVDALDSTRLTPDADMAGRDAHLSAVELAGDQMGRGGEVAVDHVVGPRLIDAEANLRAFMADSKVVDAEGRPQVMYHGTGNDIAAFETNRPGPHTDMGAVFLTADPSVASHYAGVGAMFGEKSPNVLPVYVRATHPFDYENPAHRAAVVDRVFETGETFTQGDGQKALILDGKKTVYTKSVLDAGLAEGRNWDLIERKVVQDAIKHERHDGFYVNEDTKNLAVYDPAQVKSAIGNSGRYDPKSASLTDPVARTAAAFDKLRAAHQPTEPQVRAKKAAAAVPPASEGAAKPQNGPKQPASPDAEGVAPSAVSSAAEAAAALDPDMLVHLDGMDAPMRVGDLLAKVKEEAANDVRDAKLLEVAAACDLSS